MTFILKKYEVHVNGYGVANFYAKDKNQARMRAFRALQSANSAVTFKAFLRMASDIKQVGAADDFGSPIEVIGKPAFLVAHEGGNSVSFAYPHSDQIRRAHELDVKRLPLPPHMQQ